MTNLTDVASAVVVVMAVVAAAAVQLSTRQLATSTLPVMLDLLTAAGLLHLAAAPTYERAAAAAAVVALRQVLSWSLRGSDSVRDLSGRGPGRSSPESMRSALMGVLLARPAWRDDPRRTRTGTVDPG